MHPDTLWAGKLKRTSPAFWLLLHNAFLFPRCLVIQLSSLSSLTAQEALQRPGHWKLPGFLRAASGAGRLFLLPYSSHMHVAQSYPTFCNPMGFVNSTVHEIFQARILRWVVLPSSRGSCQPRAQTCVSCISCIGRQILYRWHHHILLVSKSQGLETENSLVLLVRWAACLCKGERIVGGHLWRLFTMFLLIS